MKVIYNSAVDVLSLRFSTAPVAASNEGKPGVIMDYDKHGNLVSLEIIDASMRIDNPGFLKYAPEA